MVQAFQYTDKHGEGTFLVENLIFYLTVSCMFIVNFGLFFTSSLPYYPLLPPKLFSFLPESLLSLGFCLSSMELIRVVCMSMSRGGVIFWTTGNLRSSFTTEEIDTPSPIKCPSEEWGLCCPPLTPARMSIGQSCAGKPNCWNHE